MASDRVGKVHLLPFVFDFRSGGELRSVVLVKFAEAVFSKFTELVQLALNGPIQLSFGNSDK